VIAVARSARSAIFYDNYTDPFCPLRVDTKQFKVKKQLCFFTELLLAWRLLL
jgi:hypothetical protein